MVGAWRGFMEVVAMVAVLDLQSKWNFHAFDLRKQKDPVFFDPTKVPPCYCYAGERRVLWRL